MFNLFKRNKDKQQPENEIVPWGTPTKHKMSKEEAARDEAEQRVVEKANQERRDMYRLAGTEQLFEDNEGRRLALRLEDNTGSNPNSEHPPVCITVFWGVRELGHINSELMRGDQLHIVDYGIERGYEGRGIAAALLASLVNFGRAKGLKELICTPPTSDDAEWRAVFVTQNNFIQQGNELVKAL